MELKKTKFHHSLLWLKVITLAFSLSITPGAFSFENQNKPEEKDIPSVAHTLYKTTNSLTKVMHKPWYTNINYFAQFEKYHQPFVISDSPDNSLNIVNMKGDITPSVLSFTAGGNLFTKTSVHTVFSYTESTLETNNKDPKLPLFIQIRNKLTLGEILVEHDLGKGFLLGLNLYYGNGTAENEIFVKWPEEWVYEDWVYDFKNNIDEFGVELRAGSAFKLGSSDVQISYIFSHQQMDADNREYDGYDSKFSTSFHNLLFSLSHQWSYNLSSNISTRLFYFPDYDRLELGSVSYMYSLEGEMRYQLSRSSGVMFRIERMKLSNSSYFNTISLKFEYQFGVKKSKRRQRRYKIPKEAYKLPPIMKARRKYWGGNNLYGFIGATQ